MGTPFKQCASIRPKLTSALNAITRYPTKGVSIFRLSPTYCAIHGTSISPTRVSSARGTRSVPVSSAPGHMPSPGHTSPGPTSRSNSPGYQDPRREVLPHAGDYPTLTDCNVTLQISDSPWALARVPLLILELSTLQCHGYHSGPLITLGYVTSTGYALVGRVVTISVTPWHGRLALVTSRTAVQGGHGLAVKTMFRFNPSSPNKGECCGWGWLPRIREGS